MAKGQIRAIGTRQHLKDTRGAFFEVHVKVIYSIDLAERIINVTQFFSDMFQDVSLVNENGGLLVYRISRNGFKISTFFHTMEVNSDRLFVEHYSVDQPSLEQVSTCTYKQYFVFLTLYVSVFSGIY
jgi:hypothetical protein